MNLGWAIIDAESPQLAEHTLNNRIASHAGSAHHLQAPRIPLAWTRKLSMAMIA